MRGSSFCLGCLTLCLVACSPTFNWRDVSLAGAPLRAQMPCKPERAERQVPLTAAGTTLHLLSCETGGLTFALAWATLAPQDNPSAVLDSWQLAGWARLRQTQAAADTPPAGWTAWPMPLAGAQTLRGWQGQGLDHEGRTVSARQVYFAHGAVVYQAAVYGSSNDPSVVAPFFEALRLPSTP